MRLIPDLQNIINQYLTPYDHYQLIDKIKDKFYTLSKYLERQQEYELKVSRSIYEDYKFEMELNLIQNQNLVRNDPVCDKLKVLILNSGAGDYELNQKRNTFVGKYTQWIQETFNKYIKLIIKALKDANLFEVEYSYYDLHENNILRGVQLQNTFQITDWKKSISMEYKNYYLTDKKMRIFQLARTKYKYLRDIEYYEVSPLWKTYLDILKLTRLYRWEIATGTMGFDKFITP